VQWRLILPASQRQGLRRCDAESIQCSPFLRKGHRERTAFAAHHGPFARPSPATEHQLDLSKHSCLRFGGRTCLEDSNSVTRFTCFADGQAYIAPGSMMNLLKSLPKVKEVTINMEDNKMRIPGLWTELRADFARSLRRVHLPDLTNLHLIYPYEEPLDHRFVYLPQRRKTGRRSTQDALSTAFHNLLAASPNLKTVYLGGPVCFDESLFWPNKGKSNNEARAAKSMPSLRSFTFTMRVDGCPRTDYALREFGFLYSDKRCKVEDRPMPCSVLQWHGPSEWKMSESLEKLWKEVSDAELSILSRK
jgi:hypothetical protein